MSNSFVIRFGALVMMSVLSACFGLDVTTQYTGIVFLDMDGGNVVSIASSRLQMRVSA